MKHKTRRRPVVSIAVARTVVRSCPVCARVLDAATSLSTDLDSPAPQIQPGDITCCAYCRTLLTLTLDGFVPVTEAELVSLDPMLRDIMLNLAMPPRARPQ